MSPANNRQPSVLVPTFDDVLRASLHALERMFDDPNLIHLKQKAPRHPAVNRYRTIESYLANQSEAPSGPLAFAILREISDAMFDSLFWQEQIFHSDYWDFIEDVPARNNIRNKIRDSKQYSATIAEVFVWGRMRKMGLQAQLIERHGWPDIRIDECETGPLWVEVKRIGAGTKITRVRKDIKHASKQMKHADRDGAGIVQIFLTRDNEFALDDQLPGDVESVRDQALRELKSGHSRHVAYALITWADYMMMPARPDATLFVFRRRTIVLSHPKPTKRIGAPTAAMTVGMTFTAWATRPINISSRMI